MDSPFSYSPSALRVCNSLVTSLMSLIGEDLKKLLLRKGTGHSEELHLSPRGDRWPLAVGCSKSHFIDVETAGQIPSPHPLKMGREVLMLGLAHWLQDSCLLLSENRCLPEVTARCLKEPDFLSLTFSHTLPLVLPCQPHPIWIRELLLEIISERSHTE